MYITKEIPESEKQRFKEIVDKFQFKTTIDNRRKWAANYIAKTGKGASVQTSCYICEKEMWISYANSRRPKFKPVCSDSCKVDLNNLKVFLGE